MRHQPHAASTFAPSTDCAVSPRFTSSRITRVSTSGKDHTAPWQAVLAFATVPLRYGAEVVLLFFLLSGFVIHLRQARSLALGETPRFEMAHFFRRRATRLVPPLLFALVLTAVLDAAGSHADSSIYDVYASGRSFFTFSMNALFLQGFAAPTFGSNSALWSLSYEAIFYACYPLLLLARVRFGARAAFGGVFAAGAAGCVAHVLSPAIAWTITPYFAVWTLGALVAEAFAHGVPMRAPFSVLAVAGALMAPSLIAPGRLDPTVGSAIFASGLAMVMAVFVLHPMSIPSAAMLARLQGLGSRSYTLYVVHMPLLACIAALWARWMGAPPRTGWLMPAGVAAALVLAYATAPFVEMPFNRRAKPRAGPRPVQRIQSRVLAAGRADDWEVADDRQAA
jgi:peptidoglycan/LPS O-acetylase OafA/YrhL